MNSGGELDHHQLSLVATPEKIQTRANEDMISKEGAESNSLQSTGKDTNASFTGSNSTGAAENRPSLKNILLMINNQKSSQRNNQSMRQSLLDHPKLVKLKSIASVSSSNAGTMDPTSLQVQMANIIDSNPFDSAEDCSPMLAPIMPLEKIQSLCDDNVRKSCLAHCAREQERAIERNLQWVLQSEINSSHQSDNEIDSPLKGEDIEGDAMGFELPFNKELLGVGGRGLRDNDSLIDEQEDQDQDEVVYAELLLNTLMRERSEVFGQAEKSLLYRSMLNQKKADNQTAGPKFITSDQQEQAEKDENDEFEDGLMFQQAADAQLDNQKINSAGSKFDTNRYFKPSVPPVNENLFPQSLYGLSQQQYQQINQQWWADGSFAPMVGYLPQMQNLMMPDFQEQDQSEQPEQVELVNIGKGVAAKPQCKSKISSSQKIILPKVRFEYCEKLSNVYVSCDCILIDKLNQLEILDEILTLPQDEIVGINVQMNADVVNENFQIDVFGPSLLTLGTIFKTYIIDFVQLSTSDTYKALDEKLCHIFEQAHLIFAGFGVPTMITYFHQFHQNFCFLRYVPRIIDVRIMYHKVQRKGQRSFATIYQILFAKRLDITENLSDWEQRPLTVNQLKQTGVEVQSLLRMIYKLDRLSKTKDKARFRVYMHEIISKVENFHYIDNPLVYNKFTKADLKISAMNRKIKLSKPQAGKSQKKEQQKDQKGAQNQPQKNTMTAQPQITTEQDSIQQAQEQLRLFELVEQMTGVKMMPPAGEGVEPFQQAFPMQQNLVQGIPPAQIVPNRQQIYGNYVPINPVQVTPLAPMMPQPKPVQMHAGSNGNYPYVPQVPGATTQSMQVLDSLISQPRSAESSFTEQKLARIQPFQPHENSKNDNNNFVKDSAGENSNQNNFSQIYEEMQDINKFQRKDSNLSKKQSFKEQSDTQSTVQQSKQQLKSKNGVAAAYQKSRQERKEAESGQKQQDFTERKSDDKKYGSVTSNDRHVFRKKQKSMVGSFDVGDDTNQQSISIQQHAKHIQNEQRKLSKEARAREKKIMQEQHKRKNEGQDKKGKATVKSARATPMSAASLQQQTGYSVQVKQRQKRQKAQVKEPSTEQDERLQRQALADQKRRMIKQLQEREQTLQKQTSETTQNSEDKGE